jgi:pimeloyl-ACP methyl ester carboxylesterase
MNAFFRSGLSAAFLLIIQAQSHANPLVDHPGYWLGDMTRGDGRTLKMGAEVFVRADGSPWASIASPDQLAYDLPVKAVQVETSDTAILDAGIASLKLTWVKDHFEGEWRQEKSPLHFTLRQVSGFPMKVRPQTPHAPFPYKEETLSIPSSDGVTLGATLSVPNHQKQANVVVLVHGSGPGTRHEVVAGHRPFDVIADYLTRQGVAVLRYDKRGVARSTGNYDGHTSAQLADDLYAVVETLKASKQFGRIGLVGVSEGSQIAAAVAAHHPESVGFVISLAGVGVSGMELELLQDRLWASDNGASAQEVDRMMDYVRKYYETVRATPNGEPRIAALKALYASLPTDDQEMITKYRMNFGTLAPEIAAMPFLPVLLASNPQLDWRMVRCPVLALNGSLDHQVPARENLSGIVAALKSGGNARVESEILPAMNHLFQTALNGSDDEYARIDETIAPVVLQKVASFARQQ